MLKGAHVTYDCLESIIFDIMATKKKSILFLVVYYYRILDLAVPFVGRHFWSLLIHQTSLKNAKTQLF